MPRHQKNQAPTSLDMGDIEIYHPECRRKILVTTVEIRHKTPEFEHYLFIEGICWRCNRYVRLMLNPDDSALTGWSCAS